MVEAKPFGQKKEEQYQFNGQQLILYDLMSILNTIKNESLKIGVAGTPTVSASQKINKMLMGPDFFSAGLLIAGSKAKPVRGFAWMVLLKTAGLIAYQDDIIKLTRAGEGLFKKAPTVQTIKMIYDAFLGESFSDEALRIDTMAHIKGRGSYWSDRSGTEFTRPADRRKMVIDALGKGMKDIQDSSNGDSWILMAEFLRYLHVKMPKFCVAEYLGEMTLGKKEKLVSRLSDRWDCLEGTYVKCLFMEYLAVLGLLEISYTVPPVSTFISTYDGLEAFRLTELGAYCLGLTKTEPSTACIERTAEKLFHITPNLEVTAVVDHIVKFDAMMMDSCMDKVNAKTWQLSRSKLLQLIVHDAKTKPFCSLMGGNQLVVPLKTEKAFKAGLKKMGYIIQGQGEL